MMEAELFFKPEGNGTPVMAIGACPIQGKNPKQAEINQSR